MTRVRAVLFDFGNTLFAHDSLTATIERLAGGLGTRLSTATAVAIANAIDAAAHTEAELLLGRDLDAAVWDERWPVLYSIADEWVAGLGAALMHDMHAAASWSPYPSSLSTVRQLADAGVKVGVVSNTGWDVRSVFRSHGLDPFVSTYVLSYEAKMVKPDPAVFRLACERLGVEGDATVMVGDDVRADVGAVAAGLRTILLPVTHPGVDNGVGIAALVTQER